MRSSDRTLLMSLFLINICILLARFENLAFFDDFALVGLLLSRDFACLGLEGRR